MKVEGLLESSDEADRFDDLGPCKTHKISDLRLGIHNTEKVNIFVDGEYFCSLSLSKVSDMRLRRDKLLDEDDLDLLRAAADFDKLYGLALNYLAIRARSISEMERYLINKTRDKTVLKKKGTERERQIIKGCNSECVKDVLDKLMTLGYLNDVRFAKTWIENRKLSSGISKRKLQIELIKKGIDRNTIKSLLEESGRDDKKEIRKIIRKKSNKYSVEKLRGYLLRQGFSYADISEELSSSEVLLESDE